MWPQLLCDPLSIKLQCSFLQAGTSEDALDAHDPPFPPATPRKTPMAALRRSASSLKEKMAEFKVALRGKKGAGMLPACDMPISRSHIGHHDAMSGRKRKAKKVAASIRRKLIPTRSSRGKPQACLQPVHMSLGWQACSVQAGHVLAEAMLNNIL